MREAQQIFRGWRSYNPAAILCFDDFKPSLHLITS
jgi:hypothetical protein